MATAYWLKTQLRLRPTPGPTEAAKPVRPAGQTTPIK